MRYVKTGHCIWCGKTEPDVSFRAAPHIVPHNLGSDDIGFDVCDDCNHYFGTATRGVPSCDLAFKEIFNAFGYLVIIWMRILIRNLDLYSLIIIIPNEQLRLKVILILQ